MSHVVLAIAFIWLPRLLPNSRPDFTDNFLDNAIFATLSGDFEEPAAQTAGPPPVATPVEQPEEQEPEPEPEPVQPQPEPEPPEETPAAGDHEFSKRADPTPAKEDPKPAPPADPAPETETEPTGERVGDSGGGVQAAGEISLFGWYQNSVSRALYSTWRRPILAGLREPLAVLVRFEIRKDGSIANLAVAESSGVSALDRSALRAVSDASPLPRLPPAWRGSSMTAAYLFELTPEDY